MFPNPALSLPFSICTPSPNRHQDRYQGTQNPGNRTVEPMPIPIAVPVDTPAEDFAGVLIGEVPEFAVV
jgi:hypothetical protein